ncbi:MAG: radical SAM protein [Cystobacterineae bacterium]|nr:radical SAM protein [Cystobacterineae bacterium]
MEFHPKWVAWEMTRRCNLRCVHCRSSSEAEVCGHPDFDTQTALRVVDNICAFSSPVLVLSGGEPLLREDIFEIAHYGTQKGLRMCMATNGTLVTDVICERMLASGICMVSLSLDGASAQVHDDFRAQKGAFEGTLNAARLFRQHGIPFLINSSFTKRNQEEVAKTYALAKEVGAKAWYMFMVVPTGRGEEMLSELISPADYELLLEWHAHMEKEEEALLVRPTCAPHYYRLTLQQAKAAGEKYKRRSLAFSTGGSKGCLAGQLICFISVDGEVFPCSYFPVSAGNIFRQGFEEIWKEGAVFQELRDFARLKGRCGSCEYVNVCGGCRARALSMTGDYMAEEPFCNHVPLKQRQTAFTEGSPGFI